MLGSSFAHNFTKKPFVCSDTPSKILSTTFRTESETITNLPIYNLFSKINTPRGRFELPRCYHQRLSRPPPFRTRLPRHVRLPLKTVCAIFSG